MFQNRNDLLLNNPVQLNYGIAVLDLDRDGQFELFVAGFGSSNLVLKWNGSGFVNIAGGAAKENQILADEDGRAIGVAAADIDGDGQEELYILNTDTFSGRKQIGDRLFDWQNGQWIDLFSLPKNQDALNLTAGRSVACVDRQGNGRYGFFVANYGGPMRLYELNADGMIADVAAEAKLNLVTGGRGVVSLPLVSDRMDIFAVNENGKNFLFRNLGNGTFEEIADQTGLSDPYEHGRGVTVLDIEQNERFALVYGNWQGAHRMFVQREGGFQNVAPEAMARPSRIRTVIAADFDNDGVEELFFNNIGEPNRLFGLRNGQWVAIDIGDAAEPSGLGTGAAIGDFDRDGRLELLIAHGESNAQPLSLYHAPDNGNDWLRVLPLTPQGAPARGAIVTLFGRTTQRRAIDAGSGYLCQMEPVAHFGLGTDSQVDAIEVRWLDGTKAIVEMPSVNQLLIVEYPKAR